MLNKLWGEHYFFIISSKKKLQSMNEYCAQVSVHVFSISFFFGAAFYILLTWLCFLNFYSKKNGKLKTYKNNPHLNKTTKCAIFAYLPYLRYKWNQLSIDKATFILIVKFTCAEGRIDTGSLTFIIYLSVSGLQYFSKLRCCNRLAQA